jgi:hypothetical protein
MEHWLIGSIEFGRVPVASRQSPWSSTIEFSTQIDTHIRYQSGTLNGDELVQNTELITNRWVVRIAGRMFSHFFRSSLY